MEKRRQGHPSETRIWYNGEKTDIPDTFVQDNVCGEPIFILERMNPFKSYVQVCSQSIVIVWRMHRLYPNASIT